MTETRRCDQCGKHLITHRRGARFCGDECKNAWHNKHRRSQSTTGKRFTHADGGVGTRGGNVRSVDEARQLQTASKALDRWRLVMEVQIHRTLLETGHFHIDDLDCLDLPAEAFKVRGTLVSSVRRSGVMRSTNVYRKVSHKAANGRPAPIYEITPKGREQLPKLVGLSSGSSGEVDAAAQSGKKESAGLSAAAQLNDSTAGSGRSIEPGGLTLDAGRSRGKNDQGAAPPSSVAGIESPDSLVQLDEAKPKPRNAIFDDDWSDAA